MNEERKIRAARTAHRVYVACAKTSAWLAPAKDWEMMSRADREALFVTVEQVAAGWEAEHIHQARCDALRKDGWVYGPEESREKRTLPMLVPYSELDQRALLLDAVILSAIRFALEGA